ncbi:S-layer homology domain-containing protein [Brachybacterium sillae]|uniref:S-layer homology domain-containing protein n=1 Tax=Brachybacterium sillae TaxID=2810536 RepID=UPI00217DF5F2|nr:S-layer homology domain-containing protein [Brachybacterium sillae]
MHQITLTRRHALSALLAGGAVAATGSALAPGAQAVGIFSDVPASTLFFAEIQWMHDQGISTGWTVGDRLQYRPAEYVHRDAMAAFFYRLAGEPPFAAPRTSPFRDIRPGQMFYKEITWMADWGISTGWPDGSSVRWRTSTATPWPRSCTAWPAPRRIVSRPPPGSAMCR